MGTTYQLESMDTCVEEMRELWPLHWSEIALDKDKVPLEPDVETFSLLEDCGQLQILTVRNEGRLVGYHVSLVRQHLHYRSSLTAYVDMYFVHPDYRAGMVGVKLFSESERFLRERGVQRVYTGTKLHHDVGTVLERLGHKQTERLFVKFLKD